MASINDEKFTYSLFTRSHCYEKSQSYCCHGHIVTIPLLPRSHFFYGESNEETSLLGLKPMHIAAKLQFSRGCLSKRNVFFLYQFFLRRAVWEEEGGSHG
jgi:hypothetical protein